MEKGVNKDNIKKEIKRIIASDSALKEEYDILFKDKTGYMKNMIYNHIVETNPGLAKSFKEYSSGDEEHVRKTYIHIINSETKKLLEKSLNIEITNEELDAIIGEVVDDLSELRERKALEKEKKAIEPAEEKAEYRVWYKDSEPKGKPIYTEDKEAEIKNVKNYNLLIVREETRTQVFINGKKSKRPPGKLAYRILSYVLKHKGSGGTAWDVAQHVWSSKYTIPFKDVRESIKTIGMQQRIEKARIEQSTEDIEHISALVRRRITDLNKYFLKKLNIKLEAKEMDEYELTTVPKYCLIEKS
jgi:hypothetical protein